jgi:pyruvate dehydrogenase (quinone)
MRVMSGDPKFEPSQTLPDFPYARYAELLGLRGIFVDNPSDVAGAWDTALASDKPCVLEAYTDPEVPPLPPHITFHQAKGFASSILKGDPAARQVIEQALRNMFPRIAKKDSGAKG